MSRAVVDSGPIIHLSEIGLFRALACFDLLIPEAVYRELEKKDAPGKGEISSYKMEKLSAREKELAALLVEKHEIGLGEAEAISMAKNRGINLVLTDDLDARETAKDLGLEPHGSVGIILRAFRDKKLSREETIDGLTSLAEDSSLFITRRLVGEAIGAVEKYELP
ncbi:MAG: hypothetical protein GXO65_05455 [Euryarchaeota archaeon]|nr:hypothetical protein [Euryarchaeota archaeon]